MGTRNLYPVFLKFHRIELKIAASPRLFPEFDPNSVIYVPFGSNDSLVEMPMKTIPFLNEFSLVKYQCRVVFKHPWFPYASDTEKVSPGLRTFTVVLISSFLHRSTNSSGLPFKTGKVP